MTRHYFTLFAMKNRPSGLTAFEKLKEKCSLKRKKQLVRVIRGNSFMLKEAATASNS